MKLAFFFWCPFLFLLNLLWTGSCTAPNPSSRLIGEEALFDRITARDYLVKIAELPADQEIQYLDIRTLAAYEAGHIEGAMHLPLSGFEEKGRKLLQELGKKSCVIYGENTHDANLVFAFLTHVGIPNLKIMEGGWTAWQFKQGATTADSLSLLPTEAPAYAYQVIFQDALKWQELKEKAQQEAASKPARKIIPAPKKIIVPKKKPAEAEEEGC